MPVESHLPVVSVMGGCERYWSESTFPCCGPLGLDPTLTALPQHAVAVDLGTDSSKRRRECILDYNSSMLKRTDGEITCIKRSRSELYRWPRIKNRVLSLNEDRRRKSHGSYRD